MLIKLLNRLEETLVATLIALATVIIFVSVVHRFVATTEMFGEFAASINLAWAQELCILMFVWMAKFGAAYGVRTGIHVGVDVLINKLSTPLRNKFVLLGLASGALFTFIVGSLGSHFVWHNGMNYAVLTTFGMEVVDIYEGPVTPDLEWPTWIVYMAIPLGSYLMCFRFMQVFVEFLRTGELPHHDHGHVDGLEEEVPTTVGEAIEAAEEIEHAHAGHPEALQHNKNKKTGG